MGARTAGDARQRRRVLPQRGGVARHFGQERSGRGFGQPAKRPYHGGGQTRQGRGHGVVAGAPGARAGALGGAGGHHRGRRLLQRGLPPLLAGRPVRGGCHAVRRRLRSHLDAGARRHRLPAGRGRGGGLLAQSGNGGGDVGIMKGYDFHTHPVLVREMTARHPELVAAAREQFYIGNTFQPLETFHLELDAAGLGKAVILPIDATTSRGYRVYSNEQIAELCGLSDRLGGFASVDPHNEAAPDLLEHAIRELGLRGLKLAPPMQEFFPDDAKLSGLYRRGQEMGVPTPFPPRGSRAAASSTAIPCASKMWRRSSQSCESSWRTWRGRGWWMPWHWRSSIPTSPWIPRLCTSITHAISSPSR